MKRRWVYLTCAVLFAWGCTPVCFAAEESAAPTVDLKHVARALELSAAFKEIARVSRPSVVSISSVKRLAARKAPDRSRIPEDLGIDKFFEDDLFERFFKFREPQGSFEQQGRGSGVIVRDNGYILTNNHLVGDADEVLVTLADKRQFPGKVIGTDKATDLAVLKIEATGLPAARLGDSDQLDAGEWVLAIGSPFGLDQTVTAGIISAKGRDHVGITDYGDFLQTDAAINPGNSGGALVNLKGEVIGINTAIASRTGGYMGVGFAIPSNLAGDILQSILKDGRVTRGRLGAVVQDLTREMADSFHFKAAAGALISDVMPKSPAEDAGLRAGDIVVRFNGQPMSDATQLRKMVAATPPKTKVEIEIFRDGKPLHLTVTISLLEDGESHVAKTGAESATELGMSVESLTPELARQFHLVDKQGVVITHVETGSLAARAGIRPGDLLLAVGNRSITTAADVREALKEHGLAKGVRLQLKREGVRQFVLLRETMR